ISARRRGALPDTIVAIVVVAIIAGLLATPHVAVAAAGLLTADARVRVIGVLVVAIFLSRPYVPITAASRDAAVQARVFVAIVAVVTRLLATPHVTVTAARGFTAHAGVGINIVAI